MLLRVLTVNTHKGFASLRRRVVVHRLREAIRATGADVVFLQEVVGEHLAHATNHADWPERPHHEFLADEFWADSVYGKNAVYPHGHHGNALLSVFPILSAENVDISTNRLEQRGFLHCVLQLPEPDCVVHCLCVHLGLFANSRRKQLHMLEGYVRRSVPEGEPLVVAGDFNDWSGRNIHRFAAALRLHDVVRETQGRWVRTFPSWLPVLGLDRIYSRGLVGLRSEAFRHRQWPMLTDHAALLAEMAVGAEE